MQAFLTGIGRSAPGEFGHAALKRGLSGDALVSGPVVSRGPARNEAKENPVRGADFERGKFSGGDLNRSGLVRLRANAAHQI